MAYAAPVPSAPPANASGATPAAKYSMVWYNPCTDGSGNYTYCTWTVPSGVTVIGVTLVGGNGGNVISSYGSSIYNTSGGIGGELIDQLMNVSPGETLEIYVGENGGNSQSYESNNNNGGLGYGNGGNGGFAVDEASNPPGCINGYIYGFLGAGGGGSSAVVNTNTNIAIFAPGGGGAGSATGTYNGGCYINSNNYSASNGDIGAGGGGGVGGYIIGGTGGTGGGGNGGYYNYDDNGGNGGWPSVTGYNSVGDSSNILPGPGYPFVEIQWN